MFRLLLGAVAGAVAMAWAKDKKFEELERTVDKLAKALEDRAKAAYYSRSKPSPGPTVGPTESTSDQTQEKPN